MAELKTAAEASAAKVESRRPKSRKIPGTHLYEGFSTVLSTTNDDIRRSLYIKDDTTIAAYWAVDVDRVRAIRAAEEKKRPGERRADRDRPVEAPRMADRTGPIAASCKAHLIALLRFGLRNDGLPGMTAEQFFARCRENNVVVLA